MVTAVEEFIPLFVFITFVILSVSLIIRVFKQPYVVAYILAGVLLSQLNVISDKTQLSFVGEIGIILLLFFIGMEISLPKLFSKWRIVILGPLFQIIFSVAVVYLLGRFFGWSLERSIFFGFIITLSSTAVIIKILEDLKELKTKVGQSVLGILIVQDIAVVPMMLIIEMMGGQQFDAASFITKLFGAFILIVLLFFILIKKVRIPIIRKLVENPELQIFTALVACFGLAAFTSFFGLSAALGAFFAGILVSSYRKPGWAHNSLHPFKVVFVAVFFVYIGMLIDLPFLKENILIISLLVIAVLTINTILNTILLYFLKTKFKESLYAGALLAQIGEFSFLIGAVGLSSGLIVDYEYNLLISVISLTLLLSPFWIAFIKKIMKIDANYIFEGLTKPFELKQPEKRKVFTKPKIKI